MKRVRNNWVCQKESGTERKRGGGSSARNLLFISSRQVSLISSKNQLGLPTAENRLSFPRRINGASVGTQWSVSILSEQQEVAPKSLDSETGHLRTRSPKRDGYEEMEKTPGPCLLCVTRYASCSGQRDKNGFDLLAREM